MFAFVKTKYLMATPGYDVKEEDKSVDGIKYFFVSEGNVLVVKTIEYSYMMDLYGQKVYNLGFGDYEVENDTIDDAVNTKNGDVYAVFNTVLSTIPMFFEAFQNSMMLVQGSDSNLEFIKKCKLLCKKKCIGLCKNRHRRINIYRYYINKNFDLLKGEYNFYGGLKDVNNEIIERYVPGIKYDSIWVVKKRCNFDI